MTTQEKCAQCDKPAVGDQPRLCARHTLEFYAILGGVVRARESRDDKSHDD